MRDKSATKLEDEHMNAVNFVPFPSRGKVGLTDRELIISALHAPLTTEISSSENLCFWYKIISIVSESTLNEIYRF